MRFYRAMSRLLAMMVLCLGAMDAGASVITYAVSGTLDTSLDTLNSGDAFTMTYSVDPSIPGTLLVQNPGMTWAEFVPTSAAMRIGTFSAASGPGILRQIDTPTHDQYEVFSGAPVGSSSIGGLDIAYFTIGLHDPTGTAISDALTLLTTPSIATFPETEFWAIFASSDGGFGYVHGTIGSIAAVPEPATLMLLAIGIAPLARMRRRPADEVIHATQG
jgi:hypothetical protein